MLYLDTQWQSLDLPLCLYLDVCWCVCVCAWQSFDLPLCLYFEPHVIAAACIHVAAGRLHFRLYLPFTYLYELSCRPLFSHLLRAVLLTFTKSSTSLQASSSFTDSAPTFTNAEAACNLRFFFFLLSLLQGSLQKKKLWTTACSLDAELKLVLLLYY